MAYSTIPKGSLYMNNVLYTGNGSTNAITGVGFQPDWSWLKRRDTGDSHALYDAVRGVTKRLEANTTGAEATKSAGLTTFGTDGFTLVNDTQANANSGTYASWNWKANGAGSANTDGTISSTVSANTTSGFSIVKWTSTGSTGTVGHGLGVTPKFIVVKRLEDSGYDWVVYHVNDTAGLYLNSAVVNNDSSAAAIFDRSPTSTVFNITADGRIGGNTTGKNYIAYCFVDVTGFSKISSYTGNSSTDGTFVYCGFKPSFIFTKATATGESWQIYDNKRLGFNATEKVLYPDTSGSESTLAGGVDFLSNGFKWRTADGGVNSSQLYIYMAFAENPFVATSGTSAIPVTAR